jgi:hypothetical protein
LRSVPRTYGSGVGLPFQLGSVGFLFSRVVPTTRMLRRTSIPSGVRAQPPHLQSPNRQTVASITFPTHPKQIPPGWPEQPRTGGLIKESNTLFPDFMTWAWLPIQRLDKKLMP